MRMGSFFTTGMLPGLKRGGRMLTIGGSPSVLPPDKTTVANLTVPELLGGFLTTTLTAPSAMNLPTAQAIKDYLPSIRLGDRIGCRIFNKSATAQGATVVVGSGGTLVGTAAIAQSTSAHLEIVMTAVGATPTYTVYM